MVSIVTDLFLLFIIFDKFNLQLLSLTDVGISDEPAESGRTFEENAKIKSDYGFNKTGIPCFADDSGICIESLNWKPGVLSKKFLNNFKNKEVCFKSIFRSIIIKKGPKTLFLQTLQLRRKTTMSNLI